MVSIIIVTYQNKNYFRSCLDSIRRQTYPYLEIIVVDNSIDHRFPQEIAKYYPEAKCYSENENLFYTGALNKGIKMSKGDLILCLNDDVVLDERYIQEAMQGFDRDAWVGMASGKILRTDKMTIDSTGLFLSPWRTAQERGYGLKDKGQFEQEGYIFGVTGAVAFYRKKMLEEIKEGEDYFDPDFRMFYEDLDLAWRAQSRGWRGYYLPMAIAYHVRGGTVRNIRGKDKQFARIYLNDDLVYDLMKNRYLTLIKNENFFEFFLYSPFFLIYEFIIWLYTAIFRFSLLKKIILKPIPLNPALKKRKILKKTVA